MKLLRLQMQGFKSFADKTEITFSDGITVLIGPNGCGKSNVSDAVRWALGEQNVRMLRGQKSEDIIFSGTENRRQKNAAEVTLVFDNSDHELTVDAAEVSVTRRLLRNGDSEFFLNRRACRLKDIHELFANTGIGRASLAIIGQNRVDQVLSARPEERRLIFEEVAGITRFRMRKTDGLRRLDATQQNMERVRDLTALLDEQLAEMSGAAEKARRYRKLMEKERTGKASESLLRMTSLRRMLSRYENEHRSFIDKETKQRTLIASHDADRAVMNEELEAAEKKLQEAAGKAASLQRAAEAIRGDYRVREESLTHAAEECARLAEEKKSAEAHLKETEESLRQMKEQDGISGQMLSSIREELETARNAKTAADAAYEAAEAVQKEIRETYRAEEAEQIRLSSEISHRTEEIERLKSAGEQAERISRELQEGAYALAASCRQMSEREKELAEEVRSAEQAGKEASEQLRQGQSALAAAKKQENQTLMHQNQVRTRREYLEKADREYASFSNTSKTVLKSRASWSSHVEGAVGTLLSVPADYTAAVEVALGGAVSHIVTDTSQAAREIIRWLKTEQAGRTTFYPLDAVKGRGTGESERKATGEKGIRGIAADLVSYDRRYHALFQALLGRVLIADTLEEAAETARKYGYRLRIVTMDGQVVNPGGSMTGGSMRKKENTFFGRRKEIEDLKEEEKKTEERLEQAVSERKNYEAICRRAEEEAEAQRHRRQEAQIAAAALTGQKGGAERTLRKQEEQLRQNREAAADTKERLRTERERLASAEKQRENRQQHPAARPDEDSLLPLKQACTDAEQTMLQAHIKATKAESEGAYRKKTIADAEEQAEEQSRLIEQIGKTISAQEEKQERLKEETAELSRKFDEAESAATASGKESETLQQQREDLFSRQQGDALHWKKLQEELLEIQKQTADRENRIDTLKQQITEERGKLEAAGLEEATAEEIRMPGNMQEIQKQLSGIRSEIESLGPVNPNAEAEYEEQNKRRQFYEQQLQDLDKAKQGLETVIRQLDTTMEAQFKETFTAVNAEFQRIVQIMFRGGSAGLELTDPEHILESGVEILIRMPGKKQQPLSLLSGGERALTVIALLISFLAYRPAPFCFFDEIDAALDDANAERFSTLISEYKKKSQFIIISHRKKTMEFADTLQGITMQEKGVSSLITVHMGDYIKEE